ncbi:MAG: hypothetical protein HOH43_07735 [Candidatus Latescibacteria bacterium]|nr:hypothetical protein [Candidatus Latescibacterota bacterium]
MIYGPLPGTPFYELVIKEDLLHDVYVNTQELFCRWADVFTTKIQHPTLSAEQVEKIQDWCFKEDFQRLGPSIIRILETRLPGYQEFKDSLNPFLPEKAKYYAREHWGAYPVFLAANLLGPNAKFRSSTRNLQQRIHADIGYPTMAERFKSVLAVGAALWTALTLKLDLLQHPRLLRTTYRMRSKSWSSFDL